MTLDERELMDLEMRVFGREKLSKRDIGYMLRYVYVQKKWFFYQKEKKDMQILLFNFDNYPNVLLKNTQQNIRKKQHMLDPIQFLILKRKKRKLLKLFNYTKR